MRTQLPPRLHPTAPTRHRDKPLYRFALKPGEGMLWCPRPRTLVLLFRLDALKTADLEAIPLAPRSGTDAGPRPIRDILAERVNKQSLLWAAGRWDDAELVQEVLAVAALPAGSLKISATCTAAAMFTSGGRKPRAESSPGACSVRDGAVPGLVR